MESHQPKRETTIPRGLTPNISQFVGLCSDKSTLATVMMLYY